MPTGQPAPRKRIGRIWGWWAYVFQIPKKEKAPLGALV